MVSTEMWDRGNGGCMRLTETGAGRKRGISDSEGLTETEAAGGGGEVLETVVVMVLFTGRGA